MPPMQFSISDPFHGVCARVFVLSRRIEWYATMKHDLLSHFVTWRVEVTWRGGGVRRIYSLFSDQTPCSGQLGRINWHMLKFIFCMLSSHEKVDFVWMFQQSPVSISEIISGSFPFRVAFLLSRTVERCDITCSFHCKLCWLSTVVITTGEITLDQRN